MPSRVRTGSGGYPGRALAAVFKMPASGLGPSRMTAWKNTEREIARLLGGHRVPVTGRQRGDVPDIAHEWLSIEVKHRRIVPAWLLDAMAQAEASKNGQQLPVVILHPHGKRHADNLVIIRLSDFIAWFGETAA